MDAVGLNQGDLRPEKRRRVESGGAEGELDKVLLELGTQPDFVPNPAELDSGCYPGIGMTLRTLAGVLMGYRVKDLLTDIFSGSIKGSWKTLSKIADNGL
jgi:hypothetical protein